MNQPVIRWLVGLLVGTALVAISSPLFVRSYVARELDSVREVLIYPSGVAYRWRSEGYATTKIGPHGMPGQLQMQEPSGAGIQLALWGDSQAEGVAVADQHKLFASIERLRVAEGMAGNHGLGDAVYPFARSGEDASIWLPQLRRVERALGVDAHVMLVVDLQDLFAVSHGNMDSVGSSVATQTFVRWSARLPAFVVHAAVHLARNADNTGWREFRWSVGPQEHPKSREANGSNSESDADQKTHSRDVRNDVPSWGADLDGCVARLKQATDRPLFIVFAPRRPEIVDGKVVIQPEHEVLLTRLQQRLSAAGIDWVDMTEAFYQTSVANAWAHGFHNGQIGVGHLNENGYELIAQEVNEWWNRVFARASL